MLYTLGSLHLDGIFRRAKPLLMLAYVTLEGPTSRRDLTALLWPHARQPESSLRAALYLLREHHPLALTGDEQLVSGVTCDAALLPGLRGEAVLEAYTGPFLHGAPLEGVSEEFAEWVETQRTRLARQVQGTALALAERSDPARAAGLAAHAYTLPGAPPAEPEMLRRLLALSVPGSPLESEVRAELHELTGPAPGRPAPRAAARMLGRASQLDALLAWAAEPGGGVALLSGPGGVGKSTLARETLRELHRLGRDVTLVDAEGTRTGSELIPRLAAARAPGQRVTGTWPGMGALLGERPVVLLDGVDDLGDLHRLPTQLSRDLPGVRWLLTGRRRLASGPLDGLPAGVFALPLGGLDVPAPEAGLAEIMTSSATELFVREARRNVRDFAVSADNAALLAALSRRLQGHPLALTLAASWLRVEPLAAVHDRILHAAATLEDAGGAGGRRGLALVAGRSWSLLGETERQALLRLSVFADFDPPDALALGVAEADLDALLEHSFLEAYLPGSERLRIYPALGSVVQMQAQGQPTVVGAARAAHADHYLHWFAAQAPESAGVDAERGNLNLALNHALERGTLEPETVNGLLTHYDRRGMHETGTDAFSSLSDDAERLEATAAVQAALQVACMWLAYRADRLLDAQTLAERFLRGPLGEDPHHRMKAVNTLSGVRGRQGRLREAAGLTREALKLARLVGDRVREIYYLTNLLIDLNRLGDGAEVTELLRSVDALVPTLPEALTWQVRQTLLDIRLGQAGADVGAVLEEALTVAGVGQHTGDTFLNFYGLYHAARAALRLERLSQAQTLLKQLKAAVGVTENRGLEASIHLVEAQLHYARGRSRQARLSAVRGLHLAEQQNNTEDRIEALLVVAEDLMQSHADTIQAQLASLSRDERIHAQQRERARLLLERDFPDRLPPLNLNQLPQLLRSLLSQ